MPPRKKAPAAPRIESAGSNGSDSDEAGNPDFAALLSKLRQTNTQRRNRRRKDITAGFQKELARLVKSSEDDLERAESKASQKRKAIVADVQKLFKQRETVELEIVKVLSEMQDTVLQMAEGLERSMGVPERDT